MKSVYISSVKRPTTKNKKFFQRAALLRELGQCQEDVKQLQTIIDEKQKEIDEQEFLDSIPLDF